MKYLMTIVVLLVCCWTTAYSATYQVGPTRTLKKLQDVAPLLSPGDLVKVDGNAKVLCLMDRRAVSGSAR